MTELTFTQKFKVVTDLVKGCFPDTSKNAQLSRSIELFRLVSEQKIEISIEEYHDSEIEKSDDEFNRLKDQRSQFPKFDI